MVGVKGRSGGARPGPGGARPGAGRKPSEKTLFERSFVGPLPAKKRTRYATDRERAAARKEADKLKYAKKADRLKAERDHDRAKKGLEKYERAVRHAKTCECCGKDFVAKFSGARYCSPKCRSYVSNRSETRKQSLAKKYLECQKFKLKLQIRSRLAKAFNAKGWKKSRRTEEMIGCLFDRLVLHIERQFLPGMSWENRSEWHIDHIVPLASASSLEEMERLNHFTNLRPLWASDNLSKGAKVETLL